MSRKSIEKNIAYDSDRKKYYVTFNYGLNDEGKNIKTTKTFDDLKIAKKNLKEFEANKTKQQLSMPTVETLFDFLDYWIDTKKNNISESTLYGYNIIINNHLKTFNQFKNLRLQNVNALNINQYIKFKIKEGLSNRTIRKHCDLLKQVFLCAIKEDKLIKNPVDQTEPLRYKPKEQNFYTVDELYKLFEITKNTPILIAIKLAGMLGLRREEISALKWDNVDLDKKIMLISQARVPVGNIIIEKDTKTTSSHRKLSIPDSIVQDLQLIRLKQIEISKMLKIDLDACFRYVFCKNNGEPYRPNYMSTTLKRIIVKNNLNPIRFHDLRHTFASIANSLGVSLYDISKALGHSTIATTTNVYTHMFDLTNSSPINAISNAINSKEDK